MRQKARCHKLQQCDSQCASSESKTSSESKRPSQRESREEISPVEDGSNQEYFNSDDNHEMHNREMMPNGNAKIDDEEIVNDKVNDGNSMEDNEECLHTLGTCCNQCGADILIEVGVPLFGLPYMRCCSTCCVESLNAE
jgi:hypothetical protein